MSSQGGEKTEKATPKRRREARDKGQVFKSTDLTTAFSLLIVFGVLYIFGARLAEGVETMMVPFFNGGMIPETTDITAIKPVFGAVIIQMGKLLLPILAAALLAGLLINFVQVGLLFSTKAAAPKLSHLNLIEGLKRMFSKRTLVDLAKAIIKLTVLGTVAYKAYMNGLDQVPQLMDGNLYGSIAATMHLLIDAAFKMILALIIMAPFDYLYQWWKYRKDLMMTKQEIRDEYKLTEGDPKTKSRIRSKQRQTSVSRMMHAVKNADVVITNPTHYAIAIQYREGEHEAPVVLAKGKDLMAARIRERANEHNIAIVENKAVARHLYFFCEIGDMVPQEMYQAVAEILAYIYKLKQTMKGDR